MSINANAANICAKTEVLVIIGYSFPSFNYPVDKLLFQQFKNLHTIFVQTEPDRFNDIKSIIESEYLPELPKENNFVIAPKNVGYTNPFFIPGNNIQGVKKSTLKVFSA